jgi:hydroxyacylglutathione hydrolase
MFLRQITDLALSQNAYLIGCQRTGEAIIIDPERDIDRYLGIAEDNGLNIVAVADTHIHADYLSGAREFVERHGTLVYLSTEGGSEWQFDWAKDLTNTRLLRGGDTFQVGKIKLEAVSSAGHTPEHLSFLVTDIGGGATEPIALLSGDFIFVGDVGRPDLLESAAGQAGAMEPSARSLYASLRATDILPEHLQILPAHGAGSACGKALGAISMSVLGYERRFNSALRDALAGKEEAFVKDILSGQPEPPRYFARMKRDNQAGPPLLQDGRLPTPRRLTTSEFIASIGDTAHPKMVIDLRGDREAFMQAHVEGSLFAPFASGKLSEVAGSYIDEDSAILLVVNEGSEVDEAVRQLARIGLDTIEGWIPISKALSDLADEANILTHQSSITTAGLPEALTNHPDALVLDVRSAVEYAESHVRGAKHIAYTRLAVRLAEVPEGRSIFVHCGSGLRASLAVPFLARHRDVIHVDGHFSDISDSLIDKPDSTGVDPAS